MDSQSTPIDSLRNAPDDTQAVNQMIDKFNNLQPNPNAGGELPPLDRNIPNMERQFENRNLSNEVYNHSSQNVAYQNDYKKEVQRATKFQQPIPQDDDEYEYEDEIEEYEPVDTTPTWKKVMNEVRIPLFVMIVVMIFFNKKFEKAFVKSVAIFGNQFNEVNMYGFIVLCLIVAIVSYLMIRFIRF